MKTDSFGGSFAPSVDANESMTRLIEIINEEEARKLVWLEPFGLPVYLAKDERLKIECDSCGSEFQPQTFGEYEYLSFPEGCQPNVTLQRQDEGVVTIDLDSSERDAANDEPETTSGLDRMIDHVCRSLIVEDDLDVAQDCVRALAKMDSYLRRRGKVRHNASREGGRYPLKLVARFN